MLTIDLNADVGESFGPWTMGQDEALMTSITSANIACGFHAGDPTVMRQTRQHYRAKERPAKTCTRARHSERAMEPMAWEE